MHPRPSLPIIEHLARSTSFWYKRWKVLRLVCAFAFGNSKSSCRHVFRTSLILGWEVSPFPAARPRDRHLERIADRPLDGAICVPVRVP